MCNLQQGVALPFFGYSAARLVIKPFQPAQWFSIAWRPVGVIERVVIRRLPDICFVSTSTSPKYL